MALLELKIEPPPYRTPLYVTADKILSKQWVNWLSNTINALLNASIADIVDISTIVGIESSFNNNIGNDIDALNVNNIVQTNEFLDKTNLENIIYCVSQRIDELKLSELFIETQPQKLIDVINEILILYINDTNFNQIINDNIILLTNNIPNLATYSAITTITNDLVIDITYHHILVDASGGIVNLTLPDATICEGKEIVVHGYNTTNLITVNTVFGQAIKRISTDIATSEVILSSVVIYFVSTGLFWKIS